MEKPDLDAPFGKLPEHVENAARPPAGLIGHVQILHIGRGEEEPMPASNQDLPHDLGQMPLVEDDMDHASCIGPDAAGRFARSPLVGSKEAG